MAGRGSRFQAQADRNPEYKKPKPIIDVKGYPMIRWATGSLPFIEHPGQSIDSAMAVKPHDLVFIIQKEHNENHNICAVLKKHYGDDINIITLDGFTRGAAETALKAKEFINKDEPIIITDSDHFLDGEAMAREIAANPGLDGLIPVFEVTDGNPKWSFSKLGADGYVEEVAEKKPISDWANIGVYYFSSGKNFVEIAEDVIAREEYTNGEFYLAPLYNKIIEKGGKVKLAYPKYVHGLGTPEDLEWFIDNTNYNL